MNNSSSFTIASNNAQLYTGTITNNGIVTVSGGEAFTISGNGALNNQAGGLVNFVDDTGVAGGFMAGFLNNAGEIRKSGGTGFSFIDTTINNTGTITVNTGTLAFRVGGSLSGTLGFANSGSIQLAGGSTFSLNGFITASGNGTLNLAGPHATVFTGQSATFQNFTNGANFLITAGTLGADVGGTLTLNLTGPASVQMSGGNIGGAGSTINTGNFQLSGGNIVGNLTNNSNTFSITAGASIFEGNLTNNGTVSLSGPSDFNVGGFGTINNQAGTLFDILDDSRIIASFNGGTITNAGTFRKSGGTGNSYINVPFQNTGILSVTSGVLSFGGSGSIAGSFVFANGGQVQIINSTYPLQGTVSASGNGAFNIAGGTLFAPDSQSATLANFTNGANLLITGGLLKADGTGTLTLNLTGAASVQMSGGNIGGTGSVLNTGNFQFAGGEVVGNLANASSTFTITSGAYIFGGLLTNTATISESGNIDLNIGGFGTLNNQAGALFNILDDSRIIASFNAGTITNAGTFRKSGGTGNSYINLPFSSTGIVSVTSNGILSFGGSGSFAGSFVFANGGQVQIINSTYALQGTVSASGNGAFNVAGGTLFVPDTQSSTFTNFTNGANLLITNGTIKADGGCTLTLNLTGPASVQMSGGNIGGAGSIINTGNFQLSGGEVVGNLLNSSNSFSITSSPMIFGGTLSNAGTISQSGASTFFIGNAGVLENQSTGLYNLLDDSGIFNAFNGGSVTNAGTFRKSGGLGTSNIVVPMSNTGTIDVQSGTLAIASITQASNSTLTGGTWIVRANSTLTIANIAISTNQATIALHGPGSSFTNIAALNNNQGHFSILEGASFQMNADLTNSGTFTVDAASSLIPAAGVTLTNSGTAILGSDTGSPLNAPLAIVNTGSLTLSSTQHLASLFNIGGTITITAGTTKTNALSITSGGVDNITSAKLIVETGADHNAVFAALQSDAASQALTSSTLPPGFGIAVLDNAVLNLSTFGGETVDANAILISAELTGDANADGHVDLNDLNTILNNLGTASGGWTRGGFDGQPTIDLNDLNDVLNNLGTTYANSSSVIAAESLLAATPTPEPTSLATAATLSILVLLRRQRRA